MIKYKITFTKEKDGVIDKDFTSCVEYALTDETALNLDPEYAITEHLTEMLLNHILKAKDKGDLSWT